MNRKKNMQGLLIDYPQRHKMYIWWFSLMEIQFVDYSLGRMVHSFCQHTLSFSEIIHFIWFIFFQQNIKFHILQIGSITFVFKVFSINSSIPWLLNLIWYITGLFCTTVPLIMLHSYIICCAFIIRTPHPELCLYSKTTYLLVLYFLLHCFLLI